MRPWKKSREGPRSPVHISSSVSWHSKKWPALNSATPFSKARRSSGSSRGGLGWGVTSRRRGLDLRRGDGLEGHGGGAGALGRLLRLPVEELLRAHGRVSAQVLAPPVGPLGREPPRLHVVGEHRVQRLHHLRADAGADRE